MPPSDRQPLLPAHVNRSDTHRLSTTQISFPSASALPDDGGTPSSTSLQPQPQPRGYGNTTRGYGNSTRGYGEPRGYTDTTSSGGDGSAAIGTTGHREGLPKLSRECLWSEIKCYGSYIVPTFLVFGVLVVGLCLLAVGWKRHWFCP